MLLKNGGRNIEFQWVPEENGTPGSVEADKLAVLGHHCLETQPKTISRIDLKIYIRKVRNKLSDDAWFDEQAEAALIYYIDPNLQFPTYTVLSRHLYILIHRCTRVPLKNGSIRASSANCPCGQGEDTEHLIIHRGLFSRERNALKQRLQFVDNRPFTLSTKVLGPWPTPAVHGKALYALRNSL